MDLDVPGRPAGDHVIDAACSRPLGFFDDGSLLVASDRTGTFELFRYDHASGETAQLTAFADRVDGTVLPGGDVLLERDTDGDERTQLYRLDVSTGVVSPLVIDRRYIHRTPVASADGTRLAYATNRRTGADFDVVIRELATGDERAFELGGWCDVAGFSPDGRLLAVLRLGDRPGVTDLLLVDTVTGDISIATADDAECGPPVWTADSSALFCATDAGRDSTAIARFEIATRTWTIAVESEWDLGCFGDRAGRVLLITANEDGASRLELRDPESLLLLETVPLPRAGVTDSHVVSPDARRLAMCFSTATTVEDVYVYDRDSQGLRQLTFGQAEVPDLPQPSVHRFESFDGLPIPVFLFEPPHTGQRPVLVYLHGGPESQWRPGFSSGSSPLIAELLGRGWAIAAPNVRGSTGYGRRFQALDDGRLREHAIRDLAALHAWLDAQPGVDASRSVLCGRSYGGYLVLAGLAFQPELWLAGVEAVGMSSLVTFLANTGDYRRRAREREYGSLAHDRDFLQSISPMSRVVAIRAPLLIQHGAKDPRVPLSESQHIHRVMSEKGLRCELVVYEDEGHALTRRANRVDHHNRTLDFLDDVLAEVSAAPPRAADATSR